MVDSDTTSYTLDVAGGLPHVIVETTDEQTSRYLTGLAQQQDTAWVYPLPDALGSVRQLTDASADATLLQSYDPFGNLIQQSGPGSSGFGYTGEQEDANTGLVFLRARYYDPSTGRFISKDPFSGDIRRSQSMNGWNYTESNPINYTDPSGKVPNCSGPGKCKVELFSTEVRGLHIVGHYIFVFTDFNENIYSVDAGPERSVSTGSPGKIIMRGPAEDQDSFEISIIIPSLRDGGQGTIVVELAEGEDICSRWACLVNSLQIIEAKNIPYRSLGQNSNSAAYTAVKACGLPTSGPQYNIGRPHPGWGNDLLPLSSIPHPVSAPHPPPPAPKPTSTPAPPIR